MSNYEVTINRIPVPADDYKVSEDGVFTFINRTPLANSNVYIICKGEKVLEHKIKSHLSFQQNYLNMRKSKF